MLWLAGFIFGVAAGLSFEYFPHTVFFLNIVVCVSVLIFHSRLRPLTGRSLLFLLFFLATVFSGIVVVKINYAPAPDAAYLAGRELMIEAEALAVEEQYFSIAVKSASDAQGVEIKGIRQMRIFGSAELELCGRYLMNVKMPNDIFLNPGGSGSAGTARLLDIKLSDTGYKSFFGNVVCSFAGMKDELNKKMRASFSADTAAFLMSVTTGYRGGFSPELRDAFSATGLAHLISISGTHFGLLFFVVFQLFKRLLSLLPYRTLAFITLYATPSQISALMSMPVMVFYLGLSDMSFPAVRSFIMISFFLVGLLAQRRGLWLNTVLLAAVIILFFRPDSLLDLSFQLSFSAVLFIGLAVDLMKMRRDADDEMSHEESISWFESIKKSGKSFVFSAGIISLAASAGTAPLVAGYFHYVSIISPVANLIVTPIAGFIVLPLALLSSFAFLFTGSLPLAWIVEQMTSFCIWLIRTMAGFSFAEIKISAFPSAFMIIFYACLAMLLALYAAGLRCRRPLKPSTAVVLISLGILPFVIWSGASLFAGSSTRVTFLDAGQADSAVIELSDNRVIVIDTGRNGFQTASYLRYRGISRIDALVISHAEADHAGGAGYLASRFRIKELWDNGMIEYSGNLDDIPKRRMLRGDFAESSGYRITALHPHDLFYTIASNESGENNDSLVLLLDTGKNRFLFSGDIAQEALDDLVELEDALNADVIKAPHHGSRSSADEIFYFYVGPRIVVISSGRNNQYGHPHSETLGLLEDAAVYRTDEDGAVQVRERKDGSLEVRRWSDTLFEPAISLYSEIANIKKLFSVW